MTELEIAITLACFSRKHSPSFARNRTFESAIPMPPPLGGGEFTELDSARRLKIELADELTIVDEKSRRCNGESRSLVANRLHRELVTLSKAQH